MEILIKLIHDNMALVNKTLSGKPTRKGSNKNENDVKIKVKVKFKVI